MTATVHLHVLKLRRPHRTRPEETRDLARDLTRATAKLNAITDRLSNLVTILPDIITGDERTAGKGGAGGRIGRAGQAPARRDIADDGEGSGAHG